MLGFEIRWIFGGYCQNVLDWIVLLKFNPNWNFYPELSNWFDSNYEIWFHLVWVAFSTWLGLIFQPNRVVTQTEVWIIWNEIWFAHPMHDISGPACGLIGPRFWHAGHENMTRFMSIGLFPTLMTYYIL